MSSNQELQQIAARAISGTAADYNSDFLAMFAVEGFTTGTFNERFLLWLNDQLGGASYTALNDAMNAFAITQGAMNWSSMGTFTKAGTSNAFLLEDGVSGILLESGSYILMES